MISVIDTNLLYYLANISTEQSTYDSTLLLNNLKSDYTEVEVSDLSILEACVAFRNDRIKLIKIFNFIKNNNICINSIFHDEHNFNGNEIILNYNNPKYLDTIVCHAYKLKKDIENSYLRFWTTSIASIIVSCKSFSINNVFSSNNYKNELATIMINSSLPESPLGEYYELVLNDFYESNDKFSLRENRLKESIISKVFEFSESLYGFTEVEKRGIDYKKLLQKDNNFTQEEWKIIFDIFSDKTITKLEKRKTSKSRSFEKEEIDNLHKNLLHFEETLSNAGKISKWQCKYLRILFESILISKNQKLNKNDIIDSMFLNYYPTKQIISVDEGLQKKINMITKEAYDSKEVFNENYYYDIVNFLNKCKKISSDSKKEKRADVKKLK